MSFILALSTFALSFAHSVVLLVALVAVAVLFSIWVYRRTVPEISRGRRSTLIALRAGALAVLLFLLFEPVLNLQRSEELAPRVAVLLDNSKSMTVEDAGVARATRMKEFVSRATFRDIEGGGEKTAWLFGGKAFPMQEVTADSLTFTSVETDISRALQQVADAEREQNLRAVVLVTDGVFTAGKNPLYAAQALGMPVHVVAVGDSTEKKDILVGRVLANSIAYLESTLPVDVTVRSAGFDGGRTRVTLLDGGRVIGSELLDLRPGVNEYPLAFSYEPKEEGVRKLTVRVDPVAGELTTKNNSRAVFVKVLKSRMKVTILTAAPSPDVSLLQRELAKDRNITTVLHAQRGSGAWYDAAPTTRSFLDADVVVLAGFPGTRNDLGVLRQLAEAVEKKSVPLMILPSRTTDFATLKAGLDQALPFELVQWRPNETEVFFERSETARLNPIVATGIAAESWSALPPLFKTESSFRTRAGADILGTMKLNGISFNEPLLLTRRLGSRKVLAWTAYGLWRWELAYDVQNGEVPGRLLSNAVRWLTTREEDKMVRITPAKEFFDSGEDVEFFAQVYNASYEAVENAAVTVAVTRGGETRELVLSPLGAGRYAGTLDVTEEGDYTFTGKAELDGQSLGTDRGRFAVGELTIEFQDTRMNNILLRQIAAATGGRYFPIDDADGLPAAVAGASSFTPTDRIIKSDIQLWNLVWLLALAVLLFAIEWYLRKQAGML
ncbi:MAG: VWA domain-containing protein [Bacteroidota bacterium]|jgi:hypothetical protein|nr:VWA domain-containing protein [Bacteroidota bacterium]